MKFVSEVRYLFGCDFNTRTTLSRNDLNPKDVLLKKSEDQKMRRKRSLGTPIERLKDNCKQTSLKANRKRVSFRFGWFRIVVSHTQHA